jgi:hypothetical protein
MWVTFNEWTGGWKVAYDAKSMVANGAGIALNNATHKLATANKVTPWVSNSTIAVSTDLAKTDGLTDHPSNVTYGWTMTALSTAGIQASKYVGAAQTADNTK